ncbi:hypothetical protein [Nocardia sp. NPDC059239]|uniref:hypothetical protein n=1 Tax=unclassified Nocardia TaxID=2637762 RepID=UPI0036BBBDAB
MSTVDDMVFVLAVKWLPFGGPPAEDIWMQFGVAPGQFWLRLLDQLTRHPRHPSLANTAVAELRKLAVTNLRHTQEFDSAGQHGPDHSAMIERN